MKMPEKFGVRREGPDGKPIDDMFDTVEEAFDAFKKLCEDGKPAVLYDLV